MPRVIENFEVVKVDNGYMVKIEGNEAVEVPTTYQPRFFKKFIASDIAAVTKIMEEYFA